MGDLFVSCWSRGREDSHGLGAGRMVGMEPTQHPLAGRRSNFG